MPWRLVVMNGWNSCALTSGAIPVPVSADADLDHVVGTERGGDDQVPPLATSSIASMALRIRLRITC